MKQKVIIIIPTYNEKENILPTIKILTKIFNKLTDYKMSILFVDDNSPDGTAKEINKVRKNKRNIHLLLNKRKGGLGKAYKKGMNYAINKLDADILFQFDADLSHDAKIIPTMLKHIEQGSDLVLGSRYVKGGGIPKNWGFHRKFLSRAGNLFINIVLLDFSIRDWTTGFRAITKKTAQKITPNLQHSVFNGYTWQIGFLTKTVQEKYKVTEVPFHFKDRTAGRSKLGPEYIINTLAYIMKLRISSLLKSRVFKFAVVGGIGALVQLIFLQIYRVALPFQLAFFLSIETAIVSNFIWNNIWTFKDRKLKTSQIPSKFFQFNLTSAGSILIQQTIALIGENTIGLIPLFTLPVINFLVDTGTMYAVTGIFAGLFWNYFAYNRFIWKSKTKK